MESVAAQLLSTNDHNVAVGRLANALQQYIHEQQEPSDQLAADLYTYALKRVDFYSIALGFDPDGRSSRSFPHSAHKNRKPRIEGSCDERGSREYNLALAQRRADSVKRALTLLGVPARQIQTVSFGAEKPKASGQSETAYALNRRADLVYDAGLSSTTSMSTKRPAFISSDICRIEHVSASRCQSDCADSLTSHLYCIARTTVRSWSSDIGSKGLEIGFLLIIRERAH
jgi:hypothetical protein